jgi:hypothetical protein
MVPITERSSLEKCFARLVEGADVVYMAVSVCVFSKPSLKPDRLRRPEKVLKDFL